MTAMARELRDLLCRDSGDLDLFGEILHRGWELKRGLAAGISNGRIDDWYARARVHGAIGGKILGAGGGGFLLLYAPPERHGAIAAALPELRPIPFSFEQQGSKIVYVEEGVGA
jgi:D-glycero-alpha-D-manno-heptose-7-phosphate kinase